MKRIIWGILLTAVLLLSMNGIVSAEETCLHYEIKIIRGVLSTEKRNDGYCHEIEQVTVQFCVNCNWVKKIVQLAPQLYTPDDCPICTYSPNEEFRNIVVLLTANLLIIITWIVLFFVSKKLDKKRVENESVAVSSLNVN